MYALFFVVGYSLQVAAQSAGDKQKVIAMLSKMNLEVKFGQMTQLTLGVVCTNKDGVLSPVALTKVILDYKVGSILNVTGHSVELYSRDVYASITPSIRRLRVFEKILLKSGESKAVFFTIDKSDLAFVNERLKTVTGEFDRRIADKKVRISVK